MTPPFQILQLAAGSMADSLLAAAKHTPERRVGEPLRGTAKLVSADRDASHEIVMGRDALTGMPRPVKIQDVENHRLTDAAGKTIGVSFPSRQEHPDEWLKWARAKHRTSDRYYGTAEPFIVKSHPDGSAQWEFSSNVALWDTGGQPPTYVTAHGNSDGTVRVRVDKGDGAPEDVVVEGGGFGRILVANSHFRRAIEENSTDTVPVICYGDASAAAVTEQLWKAGINADYYAFKEKVVTTTIESPTDVEASALWVEARNPADEESLANPVNHYASHHRSAGDSP